MPPGDNPLMSTNMKQMIDDARRAEEAARQEQMAWLQVALTSADGKSPFGAPTSPDRVVSLEDGTGEARAARVSTDNNLGAEARYGRTEVETETETVGTSSVEVLGADDARLQFTLQNLSDTDFVHVRLGPSTTAATTNDLRIDPGQMYSLPPGVAYTGAVQAIATAANTKLVVVRYNS
jgi:hypothetical protein